MLRLIEFWLGLPVKCLTAHCFRRSGATALADSGASVINIKRAGRWRSLTTVEGYLEHSKQERMIRMAHLDHDDNNGNHNLAQNTKLHCPNPPAPNPITPDSSQPAAKFPPNYESPATENGPNNVQIAAKINHPSHLSRLPSQDIHRPSGTGIGSVIESAVLTAIKAAFSCMSQKSDF